MTVQDLINKLNKFDPTQKVTFNCSVENHRNIDVVIDGSMDLQYVKDFEYCDVNEDEMKSIQDTVVLTVSGEVTYSG